MKSVLLSCVFTVVILTVAGAPTYSEEEQPRYVNQNQIEHFLRERRSGYGPQFGSPCGASSIPVAAFTGPSYQAYPAVPQYGYAAAPHYRSVEEQPESELLGFSDMDLMQGHVPQARLGGYGAAAIAGISPGYSGVGGRILTQATSGTALGVFPNANVGGCSVPLLFSCSPTVVPGRIVESQGHAGYGIGSAYSGAAADAYRLVSEPVQHGAHEQHEAHDQHEELLTHEQINDEPSHVAHQ